MDTFGVKTRRFVGCNWLLDFGSVRDKSIVSRLVLGTKWSIVMEAAKDSFNVARHGEEALAIGIIPMKGDSAEKGASLIGGCFATRIG